MSRYIVYGYNMGDEKAIEELVKKIGGRVIEVGKSSPYVVAELPDDRVNILMRSGYVRLVEKVYGGFRSTQQ